jgi:hypothetical protein
MADALTVKITGVQETIKQLETINKDALAAARMIMQVHLESWLLDAKLLVPVDTGALKESGRVLKGRSSKTASNFAIWFGGVSRKGKFVDYAIEVHENHPTGSQYLQRVVDARTPQLEDALVKELDRVIQRA